MRIQFIWDKDTMVGKPWSPTKKIGQVYVNGDPFDHWLEFRPEVLPFVQTEAVNALIKLDVLQSGNDSRPIPSGFVYEDSKIKILVNGALIGSASITKMPSGDLTIPNIRRDLMEAVRKMEPTDWWPVPGGPGTH